MFLNGKASEVKIKIKDEDRNNVIPHYFSLLFWLT